MSLCVRVTILEAVVMNHFLKKVSLDLNDLNNYCLVASVTFLGKVIE